MIDVVAVHIGWYLKVRGNDKSDHAGAAVDVEQRCIRATQTVVERATRIRIGGGDGVYRTGAILGKAGRGPAGDARRFVDVGHRDGNRLVDRVARRIGGGDHDVVDIVVATIECRFKIWCHLEADRTCTADIKQASIGPAQRVSQRGRISHCCSVNRPTAILGNVRRGPTGEHGIAVVDDEARNHLTHCCRQQRLCRRATGDSCPIQVDDRHGHGAVIALPCRGGEGQTVGPRSAAVGGDECLPANVERQRRRPTCRVDCDRFAERCSEDQGVSTPGHGLVHCQCRDGRCRHNTQVEALRHGQVAPVASCDDNWGRRLICTGGTADDAGTAVDAQPAGQARGAVAQSAVATCVRIGKVATHVQNEGLTIHSRLGQHSPLGRRRFVHVRHRDGHRLAVAQHPI